MLGYGLTSIQQLMRTELSPKPDTPWTHPLTFPTWKTGHPTQRVETQKQHQESENTVEETNGT